MTLIKARRTFQSPRLICVVEMSLPVVGDRLPFPIDNERSVVILGICRPSFGRIYLFGITSDNVTIMLQGSRARPERADAGL